jgi:hypothetical protein
MILVNQYNYIYPFEMVQKQFHELCWQLTEIKIYLFIFKFFYSDYGVWRQILDRHGFKSTSLF